jgi:hypothetical protein
MYILIHLDYWLSVMSLWVALYSVVYVGKNNPLMDILR